MPSGIPQGPSVTSTSRTAGETYSLPLLFYPFSGIWRLVAQVAKSDCESAADWQSAVIGEPGSKPGGKNDGLADASPGRVNNPPQLDKLPHNRLCRPLFLENV